MKVYSSFLMVLVIIGLGACEEDLQPQPKGHPYVLTKEVETSQEGAFLKGEIVHLGNSQVLEYGFVWDNSPNPTVDDHKKTFLINIKEGPFSFRVTGGLVNNLDYHVRSYIKSKLYVVYGNQIEFTSPVTKSPKIIDFEPKIGGVFKKIEITGEHFANSTTENKVYFGEYPAIVDSATQTKIIAHLGNAPRSSSVNISVVVYPNQTYTMHDIHPERFTIKYPWKRISDLPRSFNRYNVVSFSINDKAYLGLDSEDMILWEYDPDKGELEEKTQFPGDYDIDEIVSICTFTLNRNAYLIIEPDFDNDTIVQLWTYNPASNNWQRKADYPGGKTNSSAVFSLNKKGYYVDGKSKTQIHLWEYSPEMDMWEQKPDFPYSPNYPSSGFAIGNKGYIICKEDEGQYSKNYIYEYDPATSKWTSLIEFPGHFHTMEGFTLNNKYYTGNDLKYDFWEFDPVKNSLRKIPENPEFRKPYASFSIGGKGYIGIGQFEREEMYEFDPEMLE
ncbi:MAG: IPT/TIG domain-containing protein [Bacteroidales bacterium]|nr:IPT/TIG domain-containing protein [Bacteroidales bacterium]